MLINFRAETFQVISGRLPRTFENSLVKSIRTCDILGHLERGPLTSLNSKYLSANFVEQKHARSANEIISALKHFTINVFKNPGGENKVMPTIENIRKNLKN